MNGSAGLFTDLEVYNSIYEMEHPHEQDSPWEGASNLIPPIAPAELEALRDYVLSAVFTPRWCIVTGLNEQAAQHASEVERWLNAMLYQEREDGVTWIERMISVLQSSLRDGTSGVMATWWREERPKRIVTMAPKLDENGQPVYDKNNRPVRERVVHETIELISEPRVQMLIRKDIHLNPSTAKTIEAAAVVWINQWMYEDELRALAEGMGDDPEFGTFSMEAIESILTYNPNGEDDVAKDPEGDYDKDAGGQLDTGSGQGTNTSSTYKGRGPFLIRLGFSKQHDMNHDGRIERNVFWYYEPSNTLLGWCPYEYMLNRWPIITFAAFPRIEQFDGYSMMERLADSIDELAANKNQRINYQDMVVTPQLLMQIGDAIRNKDYARAPGAILWVQDTKNPPQYLQPMQLGPQMFQEDSQTLQYIAKVTGQAAPFTGGGGPTKQTATQSKQNAAALSTRSNTIALYFRFFLRRFLNLIFDLYLTEMDDDQSFTKSDRHISVPREILGLPYQIDVAGITDPMDEDSRQNKITMWATTLLKIYPVIAQSPVKLRALAEIFTEAFPFITGFQRVLGTEEEAKAMEQQIQQQRAMAAQGAGQPGQGGATPQGAQ
jgi:hypothetical protein